MKIVVAFVASLMVVCSVSCVHAEMICYEGFGYAPTSSVNTLAGSGDFGFLTAWSFSAGNRRASIAAPGLIYANPPLPSSTLLTNANLMRRTNFNFGVPERTIDVSPFPQLVDDNGNLGKSGTTNWLAALLCYDNDPTNQSMNVVLGNSNDNGSTDKVHNVAIGRIANTNVWHFNQHNRAAAYSAVPIVAGETVLLVAKMVFGPDGGQNDSAYLWVNPPLTNEPAEAAADATLTALNDIYYKKLLLYGPQNSYAVTGSVDEIRVGETWQDVLPTGANAKPDKPVNATPADGAIGVALTPVLSASAFSNGSAPWDQHSQSQFSIVSLDGAAWLVSTSALTTLTVPAGALHAATRYTWRVRYKGTNTTEWSAWSTATRFETINPVAPVLVCYDGAAYGVNTQGIQGLNGGSGWAAPWERVGTINFLTTVRVDSPGLGYVFSAPVEYLAVTNNRFLLQKVGIDFSMNPVDVRLSRAVRKIGIDGAAHLLSSNNLFGAVGTTNWFSFLARYEGGETACKIGVDFNLDNTGNEPYLFFIGKPASSDNWGILGQSNTVATSSVGALDGATALLLARVVYGAGGATAALWVNPPSRTEPQDGDATILGGIPKFEYRYLGVVGSATALAPDAGVDEVRFGDSWQAVLPLGAAPPPEVGTPTNVAPAQGATQVPVTPVLTASAFAGAGAGDVHTASEFRLRSLDNIETVITTGGLTSITVPAGLLKASTRYFWKVRYKGTNNPNWSEYSAETSFDTIYQTAGLIAFDSAQYAATTNGINGRTGGSGWIGGWVWTFFGVTPGYETRVNVAAPGLLYTDPAFNAVSNRFMTDSTAYATDGSGGTTPAVQSRVFRQLKHDGAMHLLDANNQYGRANTTNWVAFLARYESGDTTARYGVELTASSLNITADRFQIGKAAGASVLWGVLASNGAIAESSVAATNNETALLVTEIIHGAGDAKALLWVNPPFGLAPPTPDAILNGIPSFAFDKIALVAQKTGGAVPEVSLDELRFGDTWESVTAVIPEPAALFAALAAAIALARRTRRLWA